MISSSENFLGQLQPLSFDKIRMTQASAWQAGAILFRNAIQTPFNSPLQRGIDSLVHPIVKN